MKDRTRFVVYGLLFVFGLSLLGNIGASWAFEHKGLPLVLVALFSAAVVLFLVLYNYQPLRTERDRERVLLKRVQDSWIDSLNELERFAPGATLIPLDYQRQNGESSVKPNIVRVFDDSYGSLTIVGEEGSGKTVSVLSLTRHLVNRAQRRAGQPVPVVLSLSSWNAAAYQSGFENWLVDELKLKYDLAETVALNWLVGRRLLLILDGLDEVDDPAHCVKTLEDFLKEFNPPGIVVATRPNKRSVQSDEVVKIFPPELRDSIKISELRHKQIIDYSPRTKELYENVDESAIPKLARLPLTLMLMLVAGREDLDQSATRPYLLQEFIQKQLALAVKIKMRDKPAAIRRRLRWLARGMSKHRLAVFYIEGLQPSWLSNEIVYLLLSRFLATFTVMTLGYITMLTTNWVIPHYLHVTKISYGVKFVTDTPWAWLFIAIVMAGLGMAVSDYIRFRISEKKDLRTRVKPTLIDRGGFRNIAINIVVCWFFFLGSAKLFSFDWLTSLGGATIYAISFGLVFWFRGMERSPRSDIRTADKLRLTSSFFKGLPYGVLAGLFWGFFPSLLVRIKEGTKAGLIFWVLSLPIGAIVGGVTRGLDKVSVIEKVYPNQGTWLSLRNLILIWLVVGFGVSLLIWPYATVTMGPDPGITWKDAAAALPDSLFLGSVTGMLVGFGYAGLDVVYHVALRTILWFKRIAPLVSYATFLNNAAYLGFLRKVGGGYMFLHGSLREQFEDPE